MLDFLRLILGPVVSIVEKTAPSMVDAMRGRPIKYGDEIRLVHVETGWALHSHEHNYSHEHSSMQQEVTAYLKHDPNDYWIVREQHQGTPRNGQTVRNYDVIRLMHINTRRNLHSHRWPSPFNKLHGQQEVTAFGNDGVGDDNDNWQVVMRRGRDNTIWRERDHVRLIHMNTDHALHSHWHRWNEDQQEVTAYSGRDENDLWYVSRRRD